MAKLSVVIPSNEVTVGGDKYRKVEREAREGDIVKITDENLPSYVIDGAFYKIDSLDGDGDPFIIDEDGDIYNLCGDDFEVYEKVTQRQTQSALLNVGEYAKKVSDAGGDEVGTILKITKNDRNSAFQYIYATEKLDGNSGDIYALGQLVRATEAEVEDAKHALKQKQQEVTKWGAIGRKVGEYKAGDIVQYTDDEYGEVVPVLSVDGEYVEVQTVDYGVCTENACDMKLIVPVEQRFDLAEGGERGETPSK